MKRTINIFETVFFFLFILIAFYAITTSVYKQPFALLALGVVLCVGVFFLRKPIKLPSPEDKLWIRMYAGVWILTFIMLLVMAFSLEVKYSWDWGKVVKTAANYALNNKNPDTRYFARYPNNQFITSFLICVFQIAHFFNPDATLDTMKSVSFICSCIFLQIAVTFIYLTALTLWDRRKAFFIGVITALYTPLFLYAQFAYTDTFSLPFSAAVFYFFAKLYKTKKTKTKYICSILIGLFAAIGSKFKVMVIISLIAALIGMFFNKREKFLKRLIYAGISVISTIAIMILISIPSSLIFNYSDKIKDKYEFPPVHWVMMSMNYSGGYIRNDVKYTSSFETYNERVEKDTEVLTERIHNYGFCGLINHIFGTKLIRTWCNPSLGGDDYVSRKSLRQNKFLTDLFTRRGSLYMYFNTYMYAFHILLILGCIFSAVVMFKIKQYNPIILVGQLSLIGITAFLLIWECNSRYLFAFIPQFLITATYGWNMIAKGIKARIVTKNNNKEDISADSGKCDNREQQPDCLKT